MASLGQVCAVGIAGNMLISVFLLPVWWRLLKPGPQIQGSPRPSSLYGSGTWRLGVLCNGRWTALHKQLRAVSGNVIVFSWDAEWEDGHDGRQMEGRGIELLTMRGDEIAKWEATFNVWRKGDAPSLPIV